MNTICNHTLRPGMRLLAVMLIVFGCRISSPAQIDTTLRAFFPLQQGDIWEYEHDDYPSYPRFQVRNVGDTLLLNGRTYFHLQGPEPGGYYRMDDSLRVFRYSPEYNACPDNEYVVYDLRLSDGEVWSTCLSPVGSDSSIVFFIGLDGTATIPYPRLGVSALTKQFCEAQVDTVSSDTSFCPLVQQIPYSPRRLAKGFGFVWTQYEGPGTNLVGAIINGIQYGHITGIDNQTEKMIPRNPNLRHNYPNPFNPGTTIIYELAEPGLVALDIVDILGRHVTTLVTGWKHSGVYQIHWNGTNHEGNPMGTGMYLCRLRVQHMTLTSKLILLR